MITLRPYQAEILQGVYRSMSAGHRRPLVASACGCHALGEPIMMANGEVRRVEDIVIGDKLMGGDGTERTVIGKGFGTGELYRVTPVKGRPFVVTGDHLLTLAQNSRIPKDVMLDEFGRHLKDVKVTEWLTWSRWHKQIHVLVRSREIESFGNNKPLPISPYTLGILLGDGALKTSMKVTNSDHVIIKAISEELNRLGAWLERDLNDTSETYLIKTGVLGVNGSPLHRILKDLGVRYCGAAEKAVPFDYKTANIENRLQILAGILDTDGHCNIGGYDFVSKSKQLAEDVTFIARSVGLAAYVTECEKGCQTGQKGKYYRVYISGDCSVIPCRVERKKASPRRQIKNVLHTGFQVEKIGVGEYCGLTVDGDHRYLMGDFTITHNSGKTVIFGELARLTQLKGNSVVVLVHRRELLKQTNAMFRGAGIDKDLISVHMAQTYSRRLEVMPKPDLIITDEAHFAAAKTWQRIFDHWSDAYVVGFSATPARLDGKPLGAIFDDLILGPTPRELIDAGWLADYRYFSVTVADIAKLRRRGMDYDQEQAAELLSERAVYGDVIDTYKRLADGKRTVVYCTTVEHSIKTAAEFNCAGYVAEHIDGKTPEKLRDAIVKRFRKGKTQILTNCQIVDVGFDLPAIECCVMLRPTMSTAMFVQQSGRALRPMEGKTALILDFVGNHIRHGLPDDDRDWQLNNRLPVRTNAADDGSFVIRQCTECFAVYPATELVCPECGAAYTATRAEIQQIQEARLTEIRRREAARLERWKETRSKSIETEDDCKTYADLCLLAKKQGVPNVRKWATAASYRLGISRPWERRRA